MTLVVGLVITGIEEVMVSVSNAEVEAQELAALMVEAKVPLSWGVPEMMPVAVLTLRPKGKLAAPKEMGECKAVMA